MNLTGNDNAKEPLRFYSTRNPLMLACLLWAETHLTPPIWPGISGRVSVYAAGGPSGPWDHAGRPAAAHQRTARTRGTHHSQPATKPGKRRCEFYSRTIWTSWAIVQVFVIRRARTCVVEPSHINETINILQGMWHIYNGVPTEIARQ